MVPLPPFSEVLEKVQLAIVPAAGGAALVMCLFLWLGRWAAGLGAAAAVLVGFALANVTFPSPGDPPDLWESGRLITWQPTETNKPWLWLPRVAFILTVVGLVSRWTGAAAGYAIPARRRLVEGLAVWLPRAAAAAAACPWMVAERVAAAHPWLVPILVAVVVIEWLVLDELTRGEGAGELTAGLSFVVFGAGGVLLYHHWATGMDLALVVSCAVFGVAAAAQPSRAGTSGAIAAIVVFLPGLMLTGKFCNDSLVPVASFWLLGLAPLALTPFLIPRLARSVSLSARLAKLGAVLIPVVVAVGLAARVETLPF